MLKRIWNTYRQIVEQNCTDEFVAETSLLFWQNRMFAASVIYLIPLSLLALVPGLYMAVTTNLKGLVISDLLAVAIVIVVAFVPGISVKTRKILFNGVLYITSTALLVYLGSFGPGLLYLLGITIFVVLSLGKTYGYIALGLNTLICVTTGMCIYFDIGNFTLLQQYGLDTWIAVSTNLLFLSGVAVIIIPILYDGLQSAVIEENKLRTDLEYEEQKLKTTVQKIHHKNKELEQFSYTISHDLKEPLRMVRNFMGLLERRYGEQLDEKAHTYIHYAIDGAERMGKSIDDLLEYSRIGRLYQNKELVNVEQIIEEILPIIQTEEHAQKADIQYQSLPTIPAVPVSLKMLFQNLITNGVKYQPKGQKPQILINAEEKPDYWEFSIQDNGIGISEEHHQQIFQMFSRLHTRDKYSGNGMGLAICKKIVENHGGEIWVSSEPGKGATFYFTISKRN